MVAWFSSLPSFPWVVESLQLQEVGVEEFAFPEMIGLEVASLEMSCLKVSSLKMRESWDLRESSIENLGPLEMSRGNVGALEMSG